MSGAKSGNNHAVSDAITSQETRTKKPVSSAASHDFLSCGQPDKRAYLKQACRRIGSAVFFLGQRPRGSGLRRGEDCPPSNIFSRGISRDFVVSTDVGNLKHIPQATYHFSQYPKKYAR